MFEWTWKPIQFVQSLANPHFVQELTFKGILSSEPMIKFDLISILYHLPDCLRVQAM